MLSLSIRIGERVFVGDSAITIEAVNGRKVKLVFDADRQIAIDREVIRLRKKRNQSESAELSRLENAVAERAWEVA